MANYKTEAEALAGAGVPGWTVTGREAEFQNVSGTDENNRPTTTRQRTGNTILTVQSPDGKQKDTITVGEADDPSVKGGKAITVVTGATKNQPAATGDKPSEPSGWTPVYRTPGDPASGQVAQWDPVNNQLHPVAAEPGAKPSGQYTNIVDPNDPKGKRVIGMVDTGDKSVHTVSSDPNLPGRQIINTPTAVYAVDAENNVTKLVTIDKDSPFQAVIVDGKPYKFDPKDGTFTAGPVNEHPDIKDQNGLPMVWQADADGGGKYGYPAGVKPAAGLSVNTQAPNLIWYDTEGNIVAQRGNPNYRPPAPNLPQVGANAPMVPIEDPDKPGTIKWVPNQGQVMAGDALQNLAAQLTNTVVDPNHPLTMDQAKQLIDSANQKMTSDTQRLQVEAQQAATARGAASDILGAQTQRAQTGAGLLQQRAQAATGTLQSIVGNALSNKNITSIPGDVGANLVGGLQGWTADLMGGQATMDSAARMIQAADPQSNLADPTTQAAISTLRQMLDKHAELTGQPHPAVAATQAAQQSQQTGGMVAPGGYNPADIQWNQPPQNAPGRTMGPGGVITGPQPVQAVAPIQPVPVASGFQAPMAQVVGQNYGAGTAYTGGIAPWLAQPQPAFVAPMPQPLTAQSVRGY